MLPVKYPGSTQLDDLLNDQHQPDTSDTRKLPVEELEALLPIYTRKCMRMVIADSVASVDDNPSIFRNMHSATIRAMAQALVWTPVPSGVSEHLRAVECLMGNFRAIPRTNEAAYAHSIRSEAHKKLTRSDVPAQPIRGFRQRCLDQEGLITAR